MKKNVLIGLSWPYANGELHIGHLGSSLPADVLARFHRTIGNEVAFVSGSDCFGTPTSIQAQKENVDPNTIVDSCHAKFVEAFKLADFDFSNYSKTTDVRHIDFVQDFHRTLYKNPCIIEKSNLQFFCEHCNRFLADRFVKGNCPHCNAEAKGDSCDVCGKMIDTQSLKNPKCSICESTPVLKTATQKYIALSKIAGLEEYFAKRKDFWTINAQNQTQRYFDETLHDRAITRDLDWGIAVPDTDEKNKVIYNWAENVLGYISATKIYCEENGLNYLDWWKNQNALHYYVHAKDNIPFHSIIFPAMLLAHGEGYHLPDIIVASEYVNLENKKISKSKGTALTVKEMLASIDVDFVRYFFLKNVNDKKDINFVFDDFVQTVNGELINNWGNLVNRCLSFIKNKLGGVLTTKSLDEEIENKIKEVYANSYKLIEQGKINVALKEIMGLVSYSNKLFDEYAPWATLKTDENLCSTQLSNILYLIANIANMLKIFLPRSTSKVFEQLNINDCGYEFLGLPKEISLNEITPLFARLDKAVIAETFANYIK